MRSAGSEGSSLDNMCLLGVINYKKVNDITETLNAIESALQTHFQYIDVS